MSQEELDMDGGGPDLKRMRQYEVDYTPEPVVRQALEKLKNHGLNPGDILDPSAGHGVFGVVSDELWPGAWTYAVELREEEKDHLTQLYSMVSIQNFLSFDTHMKFDLCTSNIPFSFFEKFVPRALDFSEIVMFLGPSDLGHSQDGAKFFEQYCPTHQWRIPGRISFRGPGLNPKTGKPWGSDQRNCSWWIWEKGFRIGNGGRWVCETLPILSAHDRAWREIPGS